MFKSKKKAMTPEEIKEYSEKISKEIIKASADEMMERLKNYCDDDNKIDTTGRMAFVINECNEFTKEYVTQMLAKVFEDQ